MTYCAVTLKDGGNTSKHKYLKLEVSATSKNRAEIIVGSLISALESSIAVIKNKKTPFALYWKHAVMMASCYQPAGLLFYKEDNKTGSVQPASSSGFGEERGESGGGGAGSKENSQNLARKGKSRVNVAHL